MTQYTYTEDSKIELTGKQFETIMIALQNGIDATIVREYPEKRMFVNTATSKEVKNPTTEQLINGEVIQQIDLEGTFAEPTVSFNDKITSHMIDANLLAGFLHQEHIKNGVAILNEDNQKEAE